MKTIKNRKTSTGVELVRYLAGKGMRLFNVRDARSAASKVGIRPTYVKEALFLLARNGWITAKVPLNATDILDEFALERYGEG